MNRIHAASMGAFITACAGLIGIVALVIEVEALGDRTDEQLIGEAVGELTAWPHEPAVSSCVNGGDPEPTAVGLLNLRPETLFDSRQFQPSEPL
ncbi:MAG TPA: hypothetical protein VIV12_29755 [Streptosporangiaceae bacterium]